MIESFILQRRHPIAPKNKNSLHPVVSLFLHLHQLLLLMSGAYIYSSWAIPAFHGERMGSKATKLQLLTTHYRYFTMKYSCMCVGVELALFQVSLRTNL